MEAMFAEVLPKVTASVLDAPAFRDALAGEPVDSAAEDHRFDRVMHRCYLLYEEGLPMPTAKKRINITVDDDVYEALERLSGTRDQSVAGVGLSLIEEALEYQEDLYFSRVADQRLAKKAKRIPHDKAWD